MRVVGIGKLKAFWRKHPDAKSALEAWTAEARAATWKHPAELRAQYGSASIVKKSTVFNICGNKYRLVVRIDYARQAILIRWLGTHKEYDKLDIGAM